MMRNSYILVFILLSISLKGQQIPLTSQPLSNAFFYNPAAAGVQGYIDVSLGGRQQWSGIENAPQTFFLYANSTVGKPSGKDFSYLSLPVSNPSYYNELQNKKAKVKHAIGGRAFSDSYGAFGETGIGLDYAIHLPLKEKLHLAFGLGFQVSNFSFDKAKGQVMDDIDPTYDQFLAGNSSAFLFNGRFGFYLYTDKLRFGYSINQLIPNALNATENGNVYQGQKMHHFGNISYRIPAGKWGFTPSASALFTPHVPVNIFGGLLIDYDRLFLINVAYRNEGSLILGAGFTVLKIVRISYSYDLPINDLAISSSGSHEVLIKLMLNRKKGGNTNE